jgi:D-glycero-alpha-D-manno-heptose 1-phosphate guanylyltransferase
VEVIILAGGKGTRLLGIISDVPKPMAPVNDKPFLFYLFQWLKEFPVEKVILSIGYKSESIIKYFGNSFSGISIEYVIEEKPLGTGGAVSYSLQKTTTADTLIINGDTYFTIDLNKFFSFHSENKHLYSVALKRMQNFSRYGSVELKHDTIVRFNEKKFCSDGLINGGIYVINRKYFESKQIEGTFSLETEILEKEALSSQIKGLVFDDLFIDIGIPDDYNLAQSLLKIKD